jgi:hypothetical protein
VIKLLHCMGRGLLCGLILLAAGWGTLALHFALAPPAPLFWLLVVILVGGALAALWGVCARRRRRLRVGIFVAMMLCLFGSWWSLQPSQQRDWSDDVAQRLRAEVDGSRVILHNVRNFDWRSESDYQPRWETRQYDLDRLVSADLVLSYWMGPHIAHTLVSFAFDDGSRVVFSVEIRKQRGESFSALGGFFRKFEQTLVAADERDILRVRTNARGEDMYLYRLAISPTGLRKMFMGYVQQAQQLDRQPSFYNTITSNCTSIVFELVRQLRPGLPVDWRLLLSGHLAEYAYDQHGLLPGYDLATLQRLGQVTERAREADQAADFSTRIRTGMPGEVGSR